MDKMELILHTKKFADECVKLFLSLINTSLGNPIKGQLISSSTSVTADYRAACLGKSRASFASKLSIIYN